MQKSTIIFLTPESQLRINRDRVYLTGFSMGSYGTWQTEGPFPHTFAAIAPICSLSDLPELPRVPESVPRRFTA